MLLAAVTQGEKDWLAGLLGSLLRRRKVLKFWLRGTRKCHCIDHGFRIALSLYVHEISIEHN